MASPSSSAVSYCSARPRSLRAFKSRLVRRGDAMAPLERDIVFTALTRPQMFAGVSYSYFVLNLVVTTEIFLITKSFWAILAALVIHCIGYAICLREPRFLDLWIL